MEDPLVGIVVQVLQVVQVLAEVLLQALMLVEQVTHLLLVLLKEMQAGLQDQ